MAIFQWR